METTPQALYGHLPILLQELPILPIYSYTSQNVVNPRLGGFYENVVQGVTPWQPSAPKRRAVETVDLEPEPPLDSSSASA